MALHSAQCTQRQVHKQVGRRRAAGQRLVPSGESRAQCATWGARRKLLGTLRRGATTRPRRRNKAGARCARSAQCGIARNKIISGTHGATSRMATPREVAGDGRAGSATMGGRATKRCRRRSTKTVCNLGALREHLRITRRRNSAGRIVACRKTGEKRERNTRCGMARG